MLFSKSIIDLTIPSTNILLFYTNVSINFRSNRLMENDTILTYTIQAQVTATVVHLKSDIVYRYVVLVKDE